jgi:hypothetical protein
MNILSEWFIWYLYPLNLVVFKEEELKSPLFFATIMEGKYLLHIINETVNIVDSLRDLIYTYKYRKIITLL